MTDADRSRRRFLELLQRTLAEVGASHRSAAVRAAAKMGARETAPVLIALLHDEDPDVRVDAAAALGHLKATDAVGALVESIERDPEGEARIEAVKALGRIGSSEAVEPLIRCFEAEGYPGLDRLSGSAEYGPWFEVQRRALEALGELGDARAVPTVVAALENDDYEDLQECAIQVLSRLDAGRARAFLIERLKTGDRLMRRRAARALSALPELRAEGGLALPDAILVPLVGALTDPDPEVRVSAAQALAGSENPLVVVALSLLLNDPEPGVKREVAALFAGMRGKAALDRLHALLAEPDPALRRAVVNVLGEIGDSSSVARLVALLDAGDRDLLHDVIGALGKIGVQGPERELAGILADATMHHTIRAQAARALGRLGRAGAPRAADPVAMGEVLGRVLGDPDERVAGAALCALVEMDPTLAPGRLLPLLHGTSGEMRILAARLLGDLACPAPRAEAALVEACASGDAELRRESLLALARLGSAQAVPVLAAGLDDPNKEVRLAALDALSTLGEVHAAGGKLAVLLDDPDPGVRVSVVSALAKGDDEQVVQGLCRALGDSHAHVCRGALLALTPRTYSPACRERILALTFRFDGELRTVAAATLRRLGDFTAADRLLATAADANAEASRWIAIEALGDLYAAEAAAQ